MKDDNGKNSIDRLKNYDPKSDQYSKSKPAKSGSGSASGSNAQPKTKQVNVSSHTIEIDKPRKTTAARPLHRSTDKLQQKERDAGEVAEIRAENEQIKAQQAQARQERAVALALMSADEKADFLANEKTEKSTEKRRIREEKAEQRAAYRAMSKRNKKIYRQEQKRVKRLHKRAKKGFVVKQVLKYALIAVLLAAVGYGGYLAYGAFVDNSMAFGDTGQALDVPIATDGATAQPEQVQATAAPGEPTPEPTLDPYSLLLTQADLDFMESRVHILMLGIDESLERSHWGSFRTDTMILVSIDFITKEVNMISLPRDSFVTIFNKGSHDRINTAFGAGGGKDGGGFQNAMDTVSMTLGGIPVNRYVCFDMNVVKEVVDAIGGLEYDVDVNVDMNGRKIAKGLQYMDGQMVLDYCRQRKGDSDIHRADRQQRMIFAIFDEIKKTGQMQDIPDIYSAVTGNIYTDLDFDEIVSLAAFGMGIDLDNLQRFMLPGDYLNIDGASYWGVDQYKKRDLVKLIFGADINISKYDHVTYLQDLARQKDAAVAAAEAAAAGAQSYMDVPENLAVLLPGELEDFNARKASLLAVAAVKEPKNVKPTIQPVIDATDEFNLWFDGFKATIEARKAAATPTPEPTLEPTPSPSPSPSPSDSDPPAEPPPTE